jgi:hypothetical protein
MHLTSPHTCHIPCPPHSNLVFLIIEIKIKPTNAYKHLRIGYKCIIIIIMQVAILRDGSYKGYIAET